MLDRIDSGVGRAEDAARAMGVRRDLEVHGMGHIADRLHLRVSEMLLEAQSAWVEHAARGHDLDDIHAGSRKSPNDLLTLLLTGAHAGIEVCFIDRAGEFRRKCGGWIGMAANNRQGRARHADPRPREAALGQRVAHRDDRARVAAKIAHRREPRPRHFQRMGQTNRCAVRD